jgi:hypothetical protein
LPPHVRWTGTSEQPPSAGNGHAAAAAVLPELARDRVDHLIASIPAADKARIAFAWLKGEL